MKNLICVLFILFACLLKAQTVNPNFNQHLADSLGADERGMKMYTFVILKTGPASTTNKAHVDSAFAGHMQNIGVLVKDHKLIVAGPFGKNEKAYRGLFILNVKDVKEAHKLLETDPAIKAKLLEAEIFQWYGSAALGQYLPFHDQLQKYK
jgi:uncharacterized protein YciI